jgi:hypothetical protein
VESQAANFAYVDAGMKRLCDNFVDFVAAAFDSS